MEQERLRARSEQHKSIHSETGLSRSLCVHISFLLLTRAKDLEDAGRYQHAPFELHHRTASITDCQINNYNQVLIVLTII